MDMEHAVCVPKYQTGIRESPKVCDLRTKAEMRNSIFKVDLCKMVGTVLKVKTRPMTPRLLRRSSTVR